MTLSDVTGMLYGKTLLQASDEQIYFAKWDKSINYFNLFFMDYLRLI